MVRTLCEEVSLKISSSNPKRHTWTPNSIPFLRNYKELIIRGNPQNEGVFSVVQARFRSLGLLSPLAALSTQLNPQKS